MGSQRVRHDWATLTFICTTGSKPKLCIPACIRDYFALRNGTRYLTTSDFCSISCSVFLTNICSCNWIYQTQAYMNLTANCSEFYSLACFSYGHPSWLSGKESICQCRSYRKHWFNPWVRKISWSRTWQPTPVFLLAKFHGQRSLAIVHGVVKSWTRLSDWAHTYSGEKGTKPEWGIQGPSVLTPDFFSSLFSSSRPNIQCSSC